MFKNRIDAGKKLAVSLQPYKACENGIVIGLPRGGVVLAKEVADALHLPLDIICPRKICAPGNPEFAIGAVTETGKYILDEGTVRSMGISQEYIHEEAEKETQQAQHRLAVFRAGRKARYLKGKTVIIVDDGLATGMTMKAAIFSAKAEGAAKIVVAVPVSPWETLQEISQEVNAVVCLSTPAFFQAVGQFYQEFYPVEDQEVIEMLR